MNQAFDMRLDIKPAAPRPNKPAANKTDKSGSDSDFQKTLENATASKQPENKVETGTLDTKKPDMKNPQIQSDDGIMQENTVDLQNLAAMMAAAMMPAIVIPEETVQTVAGEVSQMVITTDTAMLTPLAAEQTIQQPMMQTATPVVQQTQQNTVDVTIEQPTEVVHTAETVTTVEKQVEMPQKVAEQQMTAPKNESQKDNGPVVTEAGAAVHSERPLFERVEATMVKVAEPVRADQPEFPAQLADRVGKAAAQGQNTIEIQLTPYELGKITIRLTVTDDGTQIAMHSANSKTVRLLTEHAANIGAIIEQNQSGPVSVSVQQEQQNAQQQDPYAQQEHQGNGQQQQQQGRRQASSEQSDDFIQQLRLGLAGL